MKTPPSHNRGTCLCGVNEGYGPRTVLVARIVLRLEPRACRDGEAQRRVAPRAALIRVHDEGGPIERGASGRASLDAEIELIYAPKAGSPGGCKLLQRRMCECAAGLLSV